MVPSLCATKGLRVINSAYPGVLKFNFSGYVALHLLVTTEQVKM